jgi:uncharacterized membrane protein
MMFIHQSPSSMPISKILLAFLLTALVFFAIDLVWLGLIAKNFYARNMGDLMADKVKWPAALLFYAIYIAGILIFVVFPAVDKGSLVQALYMGAFLGLLCYATYDLTSYALIKGFPLNVVVVDLIWGTFLTGAVSAASFFIVRWLS